MANRMDIIAVVLLFTLEGVAGRELRVMYNLLPLDEWICSVLLINNLYISQLVRPSKQLQISFRLYLLSVIDTSECHGVRLLADIPDQPMRCNVPCSGLFVKTSRPLYRNVVKSNRILYQSFRDFVRMRLAVSNEEPTMTSLLQQEIESQPEVIARLLERETSHIQRIVAQLPPFDYALIAARGSSDHA